MSLPAIERFVSSTGVTIYRIPCEAFPNFIAYAYLLLGAGPPTLVDCGSGYGNSTADLLAGLESVRLEFGEPIQVADIGRLLITHGHIDHFGGIGHFLEATGAPVGVHVLDRRVLTNYEERVIVSTKALRVYLERSGVPEDEQAMLMELYGYSKKHVHSIPVAFLLDEETDLDGIHFLHTPGHCPGQVCLVIGDILLSADHILERISPHQAPESITAYTGLGHYLDSLAKVAKVPGFDLAMGGHEGPIRDVYLRIRQLEDSHKKKLGRLMDIIADATAPPTVHEMTRAMYPRADNFHRLLAIEEVGAHAEYLYQRGELSVANLDETEAADHPVPRYRPA